MIIKGKDLIEGIKKANGVVGEGNVIEHLRGFKFNPRPEKGLVDIAGSDGRLTLLAQIPYTESESSDGSLLSLGSDKIKELIKHIKLDDAVEFGYQEGKDEVTITINDFVFNTRQKDFENDFINFEYMEFNEFDDELNAQELAFILESLTPLARPESSDYAHQTIYLNKKHAFLFDGEILAKVSIGSKNEYVVDFKSAKQIQTILKASESEIAKFKFFEDTQQVLIRTEKDVLVYRVHDTEQIDTSWADDFKTDFTFKINRLDFLNSLARTKLANENEEELICTITGDIIKMTGIGDSGEQAKDELPITEKVGVVPSKIILLVDKFTQLCGTIRTKEILIEIDTEGMMKIHDTQGRALGIMSVNLD